MAFIKENDLLTIVHQDGELTLALCVGMEFRCYYAIDKKKKDKEGKPIKKKRFSGYAIFETKNGNRHRNSGTLLALPAYLVKKENETLVFDERLSTCPVEFDEGCGTHLQDIIDSWKKKKENK